METSFGVSAKFFSLTSRPFAANLFTVSRCSGSLSRRMNREKFDRKINTGFVDVGRAKIAKCIKANVLISEPIKITNYV